MTDQELIQEAAVIRDERNQYANTAERVGTALVHMAEQIAAQGADVDKIEADVRGTLTLSQLDNPLGFTTNMQWAQGLNEDKPYTFRLVDTSGRCIGHVWLLNDADGISNSSHAARLIEVVMCCAAINEEGVLTTNARWGSPRLYYRTFCTPSSGGTPDGGYPASMFKWSLWQEYRDYVAKPIKDALAALQQQHATDVADLKAGIDAAVAAIPNDLREGTPTATSVPLVLTKAIKDTVTCDLGAATTARAGVMTTAQVRMLGALREKSDRLRDLGNYSTIGELDNAAAAIVDRSVQMSVGDLPFLMYGTVAYNNTVIYLQTLETSDFPCIRQVRMYEGGGAGMMQRCIILDADDFEHDTLVSTSVDEFTSFIPDRITAEQDSDEMRLRLKGLYDAAMGGACILNAATTQKAGLMSSVHVKQLADAKAKADKEAGSHYYLEGSYDSIEGVVDALSELPEVMVNERIRYIHATYKDDYLYEAFIIKLVDVMDSYEGAHGVEVSLYVMESSGVYRCYIDYSVDDSSGNITLSSYSGLSASESLYLTQKPVTGSVEISIEGNIGPTISSVTLTGATNSHAGVMTAAQVQKLANLEARIAALEAK